ncbi:MAG: hypothetical protein OXT49_06395 [Gammaproteobacteria bacterium]|nr:hypothetical protein [Gammaproteobacteria bacterium]
MKKLSALALLAAFSSAPAYAHDVQAFYLQAEQNNIEIDGYGVSARFNASEKWVITGAYAQAEEETTQLETTAASLGFEYLSTSGNVTGVMGGEVSRAEVDSTDSSSTSASFYVGGQGKAFYVHAGVSLDQDDSETDLFYRLGARFGADKKLFGLGLFFELSGGAAANDNSSGVPFGTFAGLNYHF